MFSVLSINRLRSAVKICLSGGVCGDCRCINSSVKRWGCCLFNAVSTQLQKSRGSLSSSSRETQATRGLLAGNDRLQLASKVVLPKPAAAETSVKGYFTLSLSKPIRRGREMREPDVTGTKNLVTRIRFSKSVNGFMIVYLSCKRFSFPLSK